MKYCCDDFKQAVKNKEILKTGSAYYMPNVYVDDFWEDALNVILSNCPFCDAPLGVLNEIRAQLKGMRRK